MKQRPKLVIVFGEDTNDCEAIIEFTRAALKNPKAIQVRHRRSPVVHLRKGDKPETRLDVATRILKQVKADSVRSEVVSVIAHQDCDAVEPAHIEAAQIMEATLARAGIPNPIAAAPAWETETWLMQFPQALEATRGCWNRVDYGTRDLGTVQNAKEDLRSKLRPKTQEARNRCRDYSESDAPVVAGHANKLGLLAKQRSTKCHSFDHFVEKVAKLG